jgi:signal transduction histidine kinase
MPSTVLAPLDPPAAPAERDRVAAELQAIVAAALGGIAESASLARALLGLDDEAALARIAAVNDLALCALEELRRLLAALSGGARDCPRRAHLARDLHDTVGHGLSLAGVLAGVAQTVLRTDRDAARTALEQLQAAVDDTAAELAALAQPLAAAPCPTELDALARRASMAGQRVRLRVAGGELGDVPAGVLASVQRIVQESLTNARKHAPGAAVDVAIRLDADAVTVEVGNGPAAHARAGRAGGCGRGIAGMRERAALLGGSLQAGPAAGGGFRVAARLPR